MLFQICICHVCHFNNALPLDSQPDGNSTLILEIDLLETDCHVLDPTPLANCSVRPKVLTVRVHLHGILGQKKRKYAAQADFDLTPISQSKATAMWC